MKENVSGCFFSEHSVVPFMLDVLVLYNTAHSLTPPFVPVFVGRGRQVLYFNALQH